MISFKRFVLVSVLVAVALTITLTTLGGVEPASAAPMSALTAPTLVGPADGEQISTQPFVFNWDAVSGAAQYRLQVSTSSSFSTLLINNRVNSDGWSAQTPFAAATYYWRVRGITSGGSEGPWSTVRRVVIKATATPISTPQPTAIPVLLAPSIVGPVNGEQISVQPFVFNWDAVAGAANYQIQVATAADFSSTIVDVAPSSDGWSSQTAFATGTYYWRVRAMGSTAGTWSATQLFGIVTSSTPMQTNTPTPIAPQNSAMANRVPYTGNSPWNTPISNPVYDRNSAQMVATIGQSVTGGKIYSDTAQYTYPVYWADKNTPRYNVPCAKYKCTVVINGQVTRVETMQNVPIPNGARQSDGNDAQMIIVDTETGIEYGFYHMFKQADGTWKADNGYQYSVNYDGATPGFGSRGAGVPYYAGMIRPWEIAQGHIDHAIAFVYPFTKAGKCVYPAGQTDGTTTSTHAIPEGARLQLNPNLTDADFDRMGLSPAGKIVAQAMQKYGLILIDTGGSPKIIAENLTANTLYGQTWDQYGYDKNVIANVPYTELRVLSLPDGYYNGAAANWGNCNK